MEPWQSGMQVMYKMVIQIQEQQAPGPCSLVDHRASVRGFDRPVFIERTNHFEQLYME
jgi:hypothetical protein